jgi:hypothetical protein
MFNNTKETSTVINHPECFGVQVRIGEVHLSVQIPLSARSHVSFTNDSAGWGALKLLDEMTAKAMKLSEEYEKNRAVEIPSSASTLLPLGPTGPQTNVKETDASN